MPLKRKSKASGYQPPGKVYLQNIPIFSLVAIGEKTSHVTFPSTKTIRPRVSPARNTPVFNKRSHVQFYPKKPFDDIKLII